MATNPRTVEDIFTDFVGRREGMLKALTTEVSEFYRLCDPEKENLCLYGYPDEAWEVNLPAEEVPPELPEPALGINFARDGMNREDWLSLVAVHSDAWLLSVAFYYGARFDKEKRNQLFQRINNLPTVFEVVTGKKPSVPAKISKGTGSNANSKPKKDGKSRTSEPPVRNVRPKVDPEPEPEPELDQKSEDEDEVDEEEHGETFCGICGGPYGANEFWICCDICEKWYHGACVKITPAKADSIKQYKCPTCAKKNRS